MRQRQTDAVPQIREFALRHLPHLADLVQRTSTAAKSCSLVNGLGK
jgi:hypothetical protein